MTKLYRQLIILLTPFLLIYGCKKEDDNPCCDASNPECANYDPCFGRTDAVSADFRTEKRRSLSLTRSLILQADTFFAGGDVYFVAEDSNAESYEWKVGSDSRTFIDQEFFLRFDCPSSLYQDIYVQLITERLSDSICTNTDLLRDTVRKMIYFIKEIESPVFGKYRGYLKNDPSTQFDIDILYKSKFTTPNPDPCDGFLWQRTIYNLTNSGCYQRFTGPSASTMNQYTSKESIRVDTNTCVYPSGYFASDYRDIEIRYNPSNKEITINFTHRIFATSASGLSDTSERLEFVGTKL